MKEDGPKHSRLHALVDSLLRLLRRKPPQTPGDPYAYRMAPLRRNPGGRSGAAVADLEDDSYRAFPPRN
jgi:hypothetical protein